MKEVELVRPGLPVAVWLGQLALYNLSSEYFPGGTWPPWLSWDRAGLAFLWQGRVGQLALYNLSSEYFPGGTWLA